MAKRRGVGDDINKFVSNIVSPWLGSGPGTPPQVQRGQELARTLVEQSDQFALGGMGRAAMAGPTEMAKQALYNATAAAAGYGAGRAVQAAATSGRIVNPIAAVRNLLKGEQVIVHGTPNVLRGNALQPYAGSPRAPETPTVFGFNPRAAGSKALVPNSVMNYATGSGRVVIGTAPKNATKYFNAGKALTETTKPVPIQEVVETSGKGFAQFEQELERAIRRAGSSLKGDTIKQRAATELKRWMARRADRTSTA